MDYYFVENEEWIVDIVEETNRSAFLTTKIVTFTLRESFATCSHKNAPSDGENDHEQSAYLLDFYSWLKPKPKALFSIFYT